MKKKTLREMGQKRVADLLEHLNGSNLMYGNPPYNADQVTDFIDYGWSHALQIEGTWYVEIRNTGWGYTDENGKDQIDQVLVDE